MLSRKLADNFFFCAIYYQAEERIEDCMKKQLQTKFINDEIISKLEECDQFDIYHIAKTGNVFVSIDSVYVSKKLKN